MKKLFLASAFALMGTFALAGNAVESGDEKSSEKVKLIKENVEMVYPIYYTTSCGVAAVTDQVNWGEEEMMNWAAALEENYC